MKNELDKNIISGIALFFTFLTLAWIVFLFPETIASFYNVLIAKVLLIVGILFISTFGDEKSKVFYGNFGVGLGFIVIYLAFFQELPNIWYFRLPFFLFFAMFGLFGVYQSLISKLRNAFRKNEDITNEENRKFRVDVSSLVQILVYMVEFLAALVTILQFIGIKLVE